VLRATAELCASGAKVSVVLPVADAAMPRGCCGIQGEQWRRLIDEDVHEAAQRAVHVLEGMGCRPTEVAIEVGPSVAEAVQQAATARGCDLIAVGAKRHPWSSGGLSKRKLKKLRRAGPNDVLVLAGPSTRR
jgi:nucleotide-binding universal stress UspA family protein